MNLEWFQLDSRFWLYPALCWFAYISLLTLYRITLHPLANFPGPKLAGASYCYEFWFDVLLHGRYTREILRLHELYGPVIRITPDELHCNDPNFIDEIYASGKKKRNKSLHYVSSFPAHITMAGVGTLDHTHHRIRRAAVSKFFSRSQILKLESLIHRNSQKLCDKILSYSHGEPFDAASAYSCFTTDTITEYCFGQSTGFLDQQGWEPNYKSSVDLFFSLVHILRHFPWLRYVLDCVPIFIVELLSSEVGKMMRDTKIDIPERIARLAADLHMDTKNLHPTVFSELLTSNLPAKEKEVKRLTAEANSIMIAGTETTSTVIVLITYYLLKNPILLDKVTTELRSVVDDPVKLPGWTVLEKLPYLHAVMTEGIRLMHGSSQRLSRIATEEELFYKGSWTPKGGTATVQVDYTIPRGYAIGMSNFIMHSDEKIFHQAMKFIPERWLEENKHLEYGLEHYMLSFSRGSRQCLGMQLAYCELYICLAALILRVFPYTQLYQTAEADVAYDHDEFIGKPCKNSNGVRLLISDELLGAGRPEE